MGKKYVPSQSELNYVEREIYDLLQSVPENEVYRMMERCVEGRMRCDDLEVDMSESDEEEKYESEDESLEDSDEETIFQDIKDDYEEDGYDLIFDDEL